MPDRLPGTIRRVKLRPGFLVQSGRVSPGMSGRMRQPADRRAERTGIGVAVSGTFRERALRIFYSSLLVLFAVAVLVFCVQNLETVAVRFLGWGISVPMPVLIVIVYLLGTVSGWGVFSFVRRSLQRATGKTEN